jgi:hypothetical protein
MEKHTIVNYQSNENFKYTMPAYIE